MKGTKKMGNTIGMLALAVGIVLALGVPLFISGCSNDEDISAVEISSTNPSTTDEQTDMSDIESENNDTDVPDDTNENEVDTEAPVVVKDEAAASMIDEAVELGSTSQILNKSTDYVPDENAGIVNDARTQFVRAWNKFAELNPELTEMDESASDLFMTEFFNYPNQIARAFPYATGAEGHEKAYVNEDDICVLASDELVGTVAKVIVTCKDEAGEPNLIIVGFYDQLSDSVKVESVSEV